MIVCFSSRPDKRPLECSINVCLTKLYIWGVCIHSGYFYSASSSPPLLRGVPHTARALWRSFTPKRHRQLRVKDLSIPRSLSGGYRAGFEHAILHTKGVESTNEPPRVTMYYCIYLYMCMSVWVCARVCACSRHITDTIQYIHANLYAARALVAWTQLLADAYIGVRDSFRILDQLQIIRFHIA